MASPDGTAEPRGAQATHGDPTTTPPAPGDAKPDAPPSEQPSRASTSTTLAQKIDHLFATVHPASGEYSYSHVVKEIAAAGGPSLSQGHLWNLRSGTRGNPTMSTLQALATFFGVPAQYFFDDDVAARVDEQLAIVTALRDTSVRRMAMRASGLSRESLATIAEMIERVRILEGLPDDERATVANADSDGGG